LGHAAVSSRQLLSGGHTGDREQAPTGAVVAMTREQNVNCTMMTVMSLRAASGSRLVSRVVDAKIAASSRVRRLDPL